MEIDNDEKASAWAFAKVHQLCTRVQKTTVTAEDAWFRNLLDGILRSALADFQAVKVGTEKSEKTGAEKSGYLAAWGCRNLAELRVVTLYVLASRKNAGAFRKELAIDGKEFYEAIIKHHVVIHKRLVAGLIEMSNTADSPFKEQLEQAAKVETARGPQIGGAVAAVGIYKKLMKESGLSPDATPKPIAHLAKKIKEKESFDPMFKICSKILHRTAMSIASSTMRNGLEGVIPFLSNSSMNDLLSIYGAINEHFKKRGVRPPDN